MKLPSRNIYVDTKEFVSAKKVAVETPGCENLQLISFHSTSKGLIGEVIMNACLLCTCHGLVSDPHLL